jgi:hypothetical protein
MDGAGVVHVAVPVPSGHTWALFHYRLIAFPAADGLASSGKTHSLLKINHLPIQKGLSIHISQENY